ncbi:MAG: exodeoxyribonuclease III [Rhodospirillales bacterium]|nr:exodeoxyribonuclease III [Rhodospirillales bacterium]
MTTPLKIASWNVNSLRVRLPHVLRWMEAAQPDILMIQEVKGESFPESEFLAAGYKAACVLQRSWNGVAILAREKPSVILDALPGDSQDTQARYLEADIAGIRCINLYLPNGNPVESEKYPYKLAWMARLRARLAALRAQAVPFLVGGDFNVIPEDIDCYDPEAWGEDALFRMDTRRAWRSIVNLGLSDAFRLFHAQGGHYTFWDYQGRAFEAGHGIRIDHFLLSPALADRALSCDIDGEPRRWDQPSDHTPIVLSLSREEL